MNLGIVISSTDPEAVWNAFRLGNFALKHGDTVKVFLLAKGVECGQYTSAPFNVPKQMQALMDAGGRILACGTCLRLRQSEGTELCPLSTMKDLHDLICESDKVISI